ncbi:MAG: glycosyltransferase [Sphingomonadales bacterium]
MARVLYLTHNGITDHIGQSQIAPYCLGLAALGHEIHIVSAEKPGREALKQRYRNLFDAANIRWSFVTYHNRPPLVSQLYDIVRMRRLALRIARRFRPQLVHCRSYLPIPIGVAIKQRFGSKLLIDFRHFFVEAGLVDSPYKFVYRGFKRREAGYFAAADHVVTLTRRAAEILNGWYPSKEGMGRFTVIPCCADFSHFDLAKVPDSEVARIRRTVGLAESDLVLLYLGSIGPDYLLTEMMKLFRELLALKPEAKFLFVSNNGLDRVTQVREEFGIEAEAVRFVNAPRDDIPAYLAITDFSVFFYRPDLSRAGCSPTKLAELLAANVPVIANTGVGDLDAILSPERNCSVVVRDFEPETLRLALERILSIPAERRLRIRGNSQDYTLESGVERYASIYGELVPGTPAAEPRPARAAPRSVRPHHA